MCVCVCTCRYTKREKEWRRNTNLAIKIKAKSCSSRGVLCSGLGGAVGLVLRTTGVHGTGEMLPRIQTYSTFRCIAFPATEGQSISISASALQCAALTGLSLSETYDALTTPPRDDKQLKSCLYPLDTWHIKPCSKRHVLAWEKAITTLDSHRAQVLIHCLHLPYCY